METKKAEHYYTKEQTSLFKPQKVMMRSTGTQLEMYTAGGVFSPKKLDLGTKLLVENAMIRKGWKVLDLGCGYGTIGVMLKLRQPSISLVMSDINSRAVKLARMNLKLHNLEGDVINSDGFENRQLSTMTFDTILLNPPQTAGKKVCVKLLEDSYKHLNKDGILQIVVRHQKGGKELSKKMKELFGNVDETTKGSGFRIYVSKKESTM